ncbi:hypothetical protein IMZ48_01045 [Candidatus Bathyarchaeota archaeon]|nr:hypothetical protein [Candidatus Bathyarchaeota archaeon]
MAPVPCSIEPLAARCSCTSLQHLLSDNTSPSPLLLPISFPPFLLPLASHSSSRLVRELLFFFSENRATANRNVLDSCQSITSNQFLDFSDRAYPRILIPGEGVVRLSTNTSSIVAKYRFHTPTKRTAEMSSAGPSDAADKGKKEKKGVGRLLSRVKTVLKKGGEGGSRRQSFLGLKSEKKA